MRRKAIKTELIEKRELCMKDEENRLSTIKENFNEAKQTAEDNGEEFNEEEYLAKLEADNPIIPVLYIKLIFHFRFQMKFSLILIMILI